MYGRKIVRTRKAFLLSIIMSFLLFLGCFSGRYGVVGRYDIWELGSIQLQNKELSCVVHHEQLDEPFIVPYGRGWEQSKTLYEEWIALKVDDVWGSSSPYSPSHCHAWRLDWLLSAPREEQWASMNHYIFIDDNWVYWLPRKTWKELDEGLSMFRGEVIKTSLATGCKESSPEIMGVDGFHGHAGGISPMYCLVGNRLLYWNMDILSWTTLDSSLNFHELCKKSMDGKNHFRGDFLVSRDCTQFVSFLGGMQTNGILFFANVESGVTHEEPVVSPLEDALMRGWGVSGDSGQQGAVLLWTCGNQCLVATPSGNILDRWESPGSFGEVHLNVDAQCVYGCLFPSGLPDRYGRVEGNHLAAGMYGCALFIKNWATGELRVFDIPKMIANLENYGAGHK